MNRENIIPIMVIGFIIGAVGLAFVGSEYIEDLANANVKNEAQILIEGYNIGNSISNEEETQRYFIEGMKRHYDIAVFGNSRGMQIYNANFPNMTLVNHAIPGTDIRRIQRFSEIYVQKGNLPEIVIIGADPNTVFSEESKEEYEEENILDELGRFSDHFHYLNMVQNIFEVENIKIILGADTSYYATEERKGEQIIRRIDGMSHPILVDRQTSDAEHVDRIALQGKATEILQITPERTYAFEMYIHTLREMNVTPILICAPYHPLRYAKYQEAKMENREITSLDDFEEYIRDFAHKNEILVIGSYDPHTYNIISTDFVDGIHPKPEAFAKIVSAHSHELYDLLYTDIYQTYDEYAAALAECQAELF